MFELLRLAPYSALETKLLMMLPWFVFASIPTAGIGTEAFAWGLIVGSTMPRLLTVAPVPTAPNSPVAVNSRDLDYMAEAVEVAGERSGGAADGVGHGDWIPIHSRAKDMSCHQCLRQVRSFQPDCC